jgi:hypothetical protein
MKKLFVLTIAAIYNVQLMAQIEVIVEMPAEKFYNMDNIIDMSVLDGKAPGTGVLFEYHGPQSVGCQKKLDDEVEYQLRRVRQKREGISYSLTLDLVACKFISLTPYSTKHPEKDPWLIYQIIVSNAIPVKSGTSESKTAKEKRLLVVTYKNDGGYWVALDKYGSSGGYQIEQDALGSLFYTEATSVFLCKKGKYNIYADTQKNTHDPYENVINVREYLTKEGITELPE